jgi:hypothetical protein
MESPGPNEQRRQIARSERDLKKNASVLIGIEEQMSRNESISGG